MRLVNESEGIWQFELDPREAEVLRELIKNFPFTEIDRVKMSNTDQEPKALEREKLLNESLAHHREELKKSAQALAIPVNLK